MKEISIKSAEVAELADAADSKSVELITRGSSTLPFGTMKTQALQALQDFIFYTVMHRN